MSKSFLVHGAWILAAVASFLLGSQVFPAGKTDQDHPESGRITSGPSKSSASDHPAGPRGAGDSAPGHKRGPAGTAQSLTRSQPVLTKEQITALGAQFQSASNPIERRLAFAKLLEGLTDENALLIRAQVEHLPEHSSEFREFHYAWGAIAGEKAVMNGKETRKRDMAATFAGWASADPAAATSWYQNLPEDGYDRHGLKWGAVHGLANADPDLALQFVGDLQKNGDKEGERMMHVITGEALRGGHPGEAAMWVDGIADEDLRVFARDRVARDYVQQDPKAAAKWAGQYNEEPEGSRLINNVGRDWAHRDPEAAVAWLESLDSSAGRIEGFGSAFGAWAGRNPEDAGNYLNDMPRSPERDSALSGFASRIVHEDPGTAISWANAIADPGRREEALINTGRHYYRRDRQGATEWLASSGLSEDLQQRIVHPRK